MASGSAIQIPSRLPLLLTHEGVLLPGSTMRTSVDSPRNMQLVRSRLLKGTSLRSTIIGVIPNTSDPTSDCDDLPSLHRCGPARLSLPGGLGRRALALSFRAAAVRQRAEPDPASPAGGRCCPEASSPCCHLRGGAGVAGVGRAGPRGRVFSAPPPSGKGFSLRRRFSRCAGRAAVAGARGVGDRLTDVWKKSLERETGVEEENGVKERRPGALRLSQLLTTTFFTH